MRSFDSRFAVVCLSQVPVPGTGSMTQTAVVDLSPPAGATSAAGSFPLFMFPQDVPVVQQLNGGMQIQQVGMVQVPPGSGTRMGIDRDEDGVWVVECPAIPGCVSQGDTRAEAMRNIEDAIKLCLEVRAARDMPLTVETCQVEVLA